jgi:hypothetical protein
MTKKVMLPVLALAFAAVSILIACGGSGPTTATPTPTQSPSAAPAPRIPLVPMQGTTAPFEWSGYLVALKVPAEIEAVLDWSPTDGIMELYIGVSPRAGGPALGGCTLDGPCTTGFLAAATDVTKRPEIARTARVEPGEYAVTHRNRSDKTLTITGEIGYYAVTTSGSGRGAPLEIIGRFKVEADGNVVYFDMR